MDSTQVIMTYQAILAITGKMLIAANNKECDQLVALEQECRNLVEVLKKENSETIILDKELRQVKLGLIHQILDNDAQIKAITNSWMIRLQEMLHTNDKTRSLQLAYQSINNDT
ncbi:MAG: flagellar protein FliT [Nitrosomonas sp. PRO4]|nr:flagellar protein FliT [Nitrosomonas sp. PRO4]